MVDIKETIIIKNGSIVARCYTKQELIKTIQEASDMKLKCIPVTSIPNQEQSFSDCRYVYTVVKKDSEESETEHTYSRPFKSKAAEEHIWNEILHSGWFYDETGIELFVKTSYE